MTPNGGPERGPIKPEVLGSFEDEMRARLNRLEQKVDSTQKGSGGVGCCGGLALIYIIYLLWELRGQLGGG